MLTVADTIQLALAAGLLCRPTVRAALAGTVAWALAVWWLGEGLWRSPSSRRASRSRPPPAPRC